MEQISRLTCLAAVVAFLALPAAAPAAGIAAAQTVGVTTPDPLPEALTKPQVRELVARLSEGEVRALLIRQLDKAAVETGSRGDVSLAGTLDRALRDLDQRWRLMWASMPEVLDLGSFVGAKLAAGRTGSNAGAVLLQMAVIFLAATVVEWLFRRLFKSFGNLLRAEGRERRMVERLSAAALRALIELLAICVFTIAAIVAYFALKIDHTPTRILIGTVFWGVVIYRVIVALSVFLFSPRNPDLRLVPLDDATARRAFVRALMVGGLIVVAWQLVGLFRQYELPEGPLLTLAAIVGTLVFAAIVALIWKDRKTVARLILSHGPRGCATVSPARMFVAEHWHILASSYILGLWILGLVSRFVTGQAHGPAIVLSLCLLPGLPMVDWLARAAIHRLCDRPGREAAPAGGSARRIDAESLEPVLVRNMRVILAVVTVALLARVWGLNLRDAAAAGVGVRVADALFEITFALVLGYAVWGFVKTAIGYYAPHERIDVEKTVDGEPGTGLTRAQTLLPLLRKFTLITLIVVLSLVVLSSLGVNIGPLIAGAGVVGLAIGFGAQTFVRDVISGGFFLADDAFRVGEYIDVGVAKGVVEKISLRSFRLRHQNGPVNTIPFGEVQKVTNYSRDWAVIKLEMRVPSDTDLEALRKIVKKVGQELMDDPRFGPSFLQPLKSQGVNRMDDDGAFVIRVKFMTRPGKQFIVRRQVFQRLQEEFAKNGIRFAPKRVMVDTPTPSAHGPAAAAALAFEKPKGG